jgi:hypothetical protein
MYHHPLSNIYLFIGERLIIILKDIQLDGEAQIFATE